ncbi:MAG: hypothetical protein Q7J16_10560 [Candidatus Cloacimonadales bacterium]|nr:hypothetical protein [Candidatus Cloacimonadales bacterium]
MKLMIKLIPFLLFSAILGIILSCTDSLDKTTSIDDVVRIEYSDCLGLSCLECLTRFQCPANAIKTDERTLINYIDTDLCVQCMECTNIFECPQDAFRTQPDLIPPAPVNGLQGISLQPEELYIDFVATGDDSTDTEGARAFAYLLTLTDENNEIIPINFVPPVPFNIGVHEYWEPIDSLPGGENITIHIIALDEAGNASPEAIAQVLIMDYPDETAPASISDLEAVAVTEESITIRWTAVGDDGLVGTATAYIIKIHTAMITESNWVTLPEYPNFLIPSEAGQPEEFTINGLLDGTNYFIAMKTVDEVGNISGLSNVASATTTAMIDIIPPAEISDLQIEANTISPDAFTINWTAVGDNGILRTASYYVVKIHTGIIDETNWDSIADYGQNLIPAPAGTSETLTITGLNLLTEYFAAIKAVDEADNVSDISNVVSATTTALPDTTPPATITDLAVEPTETEIELTWTAPGDDGMVGTAHHYEIRMSDAEITETNWDAAEILPGPPWPLLAGSPQDYTVNGLVNNQTYYFAIKAFDDNSNVSEVSNSPSGMLLNDLIPPADITNLAVTTGYAVNLTTIKIHWTAPGDNGNEGTCDHYEVRYSFQPINAANWESATLFNNPPAPLTAGTYQFCSVTGLNSATIYYFAVKAFDEVGNSNNASNSPAGKLVYQINTGPCHNCNNQCILDCTSGAIQQGPGYKFINPDFCTACGDCNCPWNLIYPAIVAY